MCHEWEGESGDRIAVPRDAPRARTRPFGHRGKREDANLSEKRSTGGSLAALVAGVRWTVTTIILANQHVDILEYISKKNDSTQPPKQYYYLSFISITHPTIHPT